MGLIIPPKPGSTNPPIPTAPIFLNLSTLDFFCYSSSVKPEGSTLKLFEGVNYDCCFNLLSDPLLYSISVKEAVFIVYFWFYSSKLYYLTSGYLGAIDFSFSIYFLISDGFLSPRPGSPGNSIGPIPLPPNILTLSNVDIFLSTSTSSSGYGYTFFIYCVILFWERSEAGTGREGANLKSSYSSSKAFFFGLFFFLITLISSSSSNDIFGRGLLFLLSSS